MVIPVLTVIEFNMVLEHFRFVHRLYGTTCQLKSGAVKLWIFSSKNLRHIFLDLRIISLLIFINLLTLNLLIIRFLTVYL